MGIVFLRKQKAIQDYSEQNLFWVCIHVSWLMFRVGILSGGVQLIGNILIDQDPMLGACVSFLYIFSVLPRG